MWSLWTNVSQKCFKSPQQDVNPPSPKYSFKLINSAFSLTKAARQWITLCVVVGGEGNTATACHCFFPPNCGVLADMQKRLLVLGLAFASQGEEAMPFMYLQDKSDDVSEKLFKVFHDFYVSSRKRKEESDFRVTQCSEPHNRCTLLSVLKAPILFWTCQKTRLLCISFVRHMCMHSCGLYAHTWTCLCVCTFVWIWAQFIAINNKPKDNKDGAWHSIEQGGLTSSWNALRQNR